MNQDKILEKLTNWSKEQKIYPPEFSCSFYNECNSSIKNSLDGGNGCLMSYVGSMYSSKNIDGSNFRLAIVGMDHGDLGGGTFVDRTSAIQKHYQIDQNSFNAHYRGVIKTAFTVLGNSGDYCKNNCKKKCKKFSTKKTEQCVLDLIIQPNSVKCTPNNQLDRSSRSTWTMKQNCATHLASELTVIKPNLVVFHGATARDFTLPIFGKFGLKMSAIQEAGIDRRGPVLYQSHSLNAHILFLNHPTYGGLDRQWNSVVLPALSYLRRRNLIPE